MPDTIEKAPAALPELLQKIEKNEELTDADLTEQNIQATAEALKKQNMPQRERSVQMINTWLQKHSQKLTEAEKEKLRSLGHERLTILREQIEPTLKERARETATTVGDAAKVEGKEYLGVMKEQFGNPKDPTRSTTERMMGGATGVVMAGAAGYGLYKTLGAWKNVFITKEGESRGRGKRFVDALKTTGFTVLSLIGLRALAQKYNPGGADTPAAAKEDPELLRTREEEARNAAEVKTRTDDVNGKIAKGEAIPPLSFTDPFWEKVDVTRLNGPVIVVVNGKNVPMQFVDGKVKTMGILEKNAKLLKVGDKTFKVMSSGILSFNLSDEIPTRVAVRKGSALVISPLTQTDPRKPAFMTIEGAEFERVVAALATSPEPKITLALTSKDEKGEVKTTNLIFEKVS